MALASNMTCDLGLWPTDLYIKRDRPFIKGYLPTKNEVFGAKRSWVISCAWWSRQAWPLILTFDRQTDVDINRDRLLIKDYQPTEFEASGAKRSWVISCSRCGGPTLPLTYLLIMNYVPTKCDVYEVRGRWVIGCTSFVFLFFLFFFWGGG